MQMRKGRSAYSTCKPHICLLTNHNIFLTVRKFNRMNSNNPFVVHSTFSLPTQPTSSVITWFVVPKAPECHSCADWSQMGTIMMNSMRSRCAWWCFLNHIKSVKILICLYLPRVIYYRFHLRIFFQ